MKILFKYTLIVSLAFLVDFLFLFLIDLNFGFNRNFLSSISYLIGLCVSYKLMTKYIYIDSNKNHAFKVSMFIFSGITMSFLTGIIFFITFNFGVTNIIYQKIISSSVTFTILFLIRNYYIFNKSNI